MNVEWERDFSCRWNSKKHSLFQNIQTKRANEIKSTGAFRGPFPFLKLVVNAVLNHLQTAFQRCIVMACADVFLLKQIKRKITWDSVIRMSIIRINDES